MNNNQPVNIIIADDHQLFADGLEQILTGIDGYIIAAKANNGKELMQVLNRMTPHLILMDINMPFMNGMDTAAEIRKRLPAVKIIFVSMYYEKRIQHFIDEYNIEGYIYKNTPAYDVKEAIVNVLQGGKINLARKEHSSAIPETEFDEFILKHNLTPREIEIIRLIYQQKTSKEIANTLCLSTFTVETHRRNIFRKLEVKNVAGLLAFAQRNNILS